MSDKYGFTTRKEARLEIKKMRGWHARPEHLYIPDHPVADRNGNVWVIACRVGNSDPLYLRMDGYVR